MRAQITIGFLGCLAASLILLSSERPQVLIISTTPEAIICDQPATLVWRAQNADHVFISGIGQVSAQGSQEVRPHETTAYTIVAEGPSGRASKTTTLRVSGCNRGDSEFPQDYDRFQTPVSADRSVSSYADFLAHIHRVLQDDMGFSVKEFQDSDARFFFVTKLTSRRELVGSDETRIGERRISYFVEIASKKPSSKDVTYTIKAMIQYKRRIEGIWRPESNENLYRKEIDKLRWRIDTNRLSRI